jgi:predicted transcriptional regulator
MTGHTQVMKLAVSLPDELFRALDARARRLRVSRSSLLAIGVRDLLARDRLPADPTSAWNQALARGGQPDDDPGVAALRKRSKVVVRGRKGTAW